MSRQKRLDSIVATRLKQFLKDREVPASRRRGATSPATQELLNFIRLAVACEDVIKQVSKVIGELMPDLPPYVGVHRIESKVRRARRSTRRPRKKSLKNIIDWKLFEQLRASALRVTPDIVYARAGHPFVFKLEMGDTVLRGATAYHVIARFLLYAGAYGFKGISEEQYRGLLDFRIVLTSELNLAIAIASGAGADISGILSGQVTDDQPNTAEQPGASRDAWIYEQACAKVPYGRIQFLLGQQAKERGWSCIGTDTGVTKAARRYASRYGLTPPPERQRGRKKAGGQDG